MSAHTPISHDPDLPFVVLSDTQRIVARFADEATAVHNALRSGGLVVDSTPKLLPTVPGWYESSEFPLSVSRHQPYQLRDGGWMLDQVFLSEDYVLEHLGTLTRLVAEK